MPKPQVFVVEGSKPWFSDRWEDKYHVVNIDEAVLILLQYTYLPLIHLL